MLNISPSKSMKSLVFSESVFEHGLETSRKIAALSLDPAFEKLDPEERQEKIAETIAFAQSQTWELFGRPNEQGFCQIRRVMPPTASEEEEEA
jgi:hypothetical protein